MDQTRIAVLKFSESFADLWDSLAEDLGVAYDEVQGQTSPVPRSGVAAILLAAGGAEKDAADWLLSHGRPDAVPVFVVGADPGRRITSQLVGRGASDYFALPDDVEILRNALASAIERYDMAQRRAATDSAKSKAEAFVDIIGESAALKEALARAERILPHPDAVALIIGDTGTGKELLARALHDGSPRSRAPFVAVNCSALPANLVESELFGHERGAFTDAHAAKQGLFEVADGGTLFLDELGTLPPDVQAKLLRVLEDQEIRRVGGTRSHRVDVRIVAATNEDLTRSVQRHDFRQDLYYRLSVITLTLPPLRERGDDVILIAEALLKRLAERHDMPVPTLEQDVLKALRSYHWPGNVRELKNAVERALLLSPPGKLNVREILPPCPTEVESNSPIPFPAPLDRIAVAAAQATLDFCAGNRSEAARRLGISRQRLRRLLDEERRSA